MVVARGTATATEPPTPGNPDGGLRAETTGGPPEEEEQGRQQFSSASDPSSAPPRRRDTKCTGAGAAAAPSGASPGVTSHFPLPEMVLLLRAASAVPLFNELPLAHSELEFALGRTRGTSAFSSFSPVLARGLLKLGDPAINAFSCFCFFLRTMGMVDKK